MWTETCDKLALIIICIDIFIKYNKTNEYFYECELIQYKQAARKKILCSETDVCGKYFFILKIHI